MPGGPPVSAVCSAVASAVFELYSALRFRLPDGKYTILAAFLLSYGGCYKVISLATGSKCLPTSKYSEEGDALHDCHAEVLARRGAVRWFLEEVQRTYGIGHISAWIKQQEDGRYALSDDVHVHMYVSTVPCGDASIRFLASFQDPEMAALKDSAVFPPRPPNSPSRGRDNYSLQGVLRTKPGRADSPPTLCMSCSDKIARWNVLGFQGALASRFLHPLYITTLIIGDVDEDMQSVVREDCERAFWTRLDDLRNLPPGFKVNKPIVLFTDLPSQHSSRPLGIISSCNDSLCWFADSSCSEEVLINGMKRGVPPKHRHNPKFRPLLSKISLFSLYEQVATLREGHMERTSYFAAKQSIFGYQTAKSILQGHDGPFAGWLSCGVRWESFGLDGESIVVSATVD